MDLAWFLVFPLSVACGYLGGVARALVLHRKTLGLEYRVQDLEARNLTTVNREKSAKRWNKEREETLDEEAFLASLKGGNRAQERYANDPPPSYTP